MDFPGSIPMHPIAHVESDFPEKFGVPRQAGLVEELEAVVVFEPEFRSRDAVRGLDGFSHLWLLWVFSQSPGRWSPTVRPPRLGGNERMGVFATRSPVRPNPIGLSCVRLIRIDDGPRLVVAGADLVDGTPIIDVKPYVPADRIDSADYGFLSANTDYGLEVEIPAECAQAIPDDKLAALRGVLAQDPRPAYQRDEREYGVAFAGMNVRFRVRGRRLRVEGVTRLE